jgi:hypothetical protein
MNLYRLKIYLAGIALLMLISCVKENSTAYNEEAVLFCYAKAGESIDSLYFTKTGGVNEAISFENLGISGAVISLYEKSLLETEFTLVNTLSEYENKKGLYYLPEADFPEGFMTGYTYRIEALHEDFEKITAETVCPPPLDNIVAKNIETGSILDPAVTDTVYYRRGRSYDDIKFYSCSFDSLPVILDERMASYRIIPDDLYRYDETFWLEDTTSAVWDEYPVETRIWKNKEKYGKDFMEYFIRSMSIHWYALYHGGLNTLVFSSTDKVFRSYMETLYDPNGRYTNVAGGYGLFSISNSNSDKSIYKIYVKTLEDKYH